MGLISEIKNLKAKHIVFYFCAFFGALAPGFLIIFYFRPELFEKYDVLKLVFLSLALTMPLLAVNIGVASFLRSNKTEKEEFDIAFFLLNPLIDTGFEIYFPLFASYLYSLNFRFFLALIVGAKIFSFILDYFNWWDFLKHKILKRNKDSSSEQK